MVVTRSAYLEIVVALTVQVKLISLLAGTTEVL